MKTTQAVAAALSLAVAAQAHMEMMWPPPFKSKANPNAGYDIDYSMTAPLSSDGSNFPCKGYQSLMGTDAGKPTAEFAAGETYNMTLAGSATHNGGSCQASLSYDGGDTWTAIKSYMGNCPIAGPSDYQFTLPNDTPSGEALFAWSWVNKVGNREFYMNCAPVTVTGGSKRAATDSFSSRPAMFVANVGNGCSTPEGVDIEYPAPGPDVERQNGNFGPPDGSCGASGPSPNPGNGGGNDGGQSPPPEESPAPSPVPSPEPEEPELPAEPTSTTIPGGIFLTVTSEPAAPTTTMMTVTTPAVPEPTTEPDVPEVPSDGDAAGSFAAGTPCTDEGAWNCVGGSQFQRCASGAWSTIMAMADGTSCQPGQAMTLTMVQKRGSRIFGRRHGHGHGSHM
jgi:hypothetical protein